MKKILYIAAAVAATVACSKNIETTTQEIDNPNAFVKGQKVTLTVGTGNQTKVSSELVTTGEDKDKVNFKWEAGDAIKVTVGTESATFTVSKLINGGVSAEFTGEMPAGGESFDVQFPVADPDITAQTYSATEPIPQNMMKFTASGCTVGTPFTLTAENAALRLNLYGTDVKVKQIYVSGHDSEWENDFSCTLSIDEAAAISSDSSSPTPFFIVVPPGEWYFSARVNGESASTASLPNYPSDATPNYGPGIPITAGSCSTTSAMSFTAGVCLNMNAFPVTTIVWAPVNCGYDATDYPYGLLYQWGRKYGQGYKDDNYQDADYPEKVGGSQTLVKLENTSRLTTHPDGDSYNGKFYWNQGNWYKGSDTGAPAVDELWGASKTAYDPCPEGWRVPTITELTALNRTMTWTTSGGPSGNQTGYLFGTSPNQVFLPAAGYRGYDGSANFRGSYGHYWSSSVNDNRAWYLYFDELEASMYSACRASGFSVRCVQE